MGFCGISTENKVGRKGRRKSLPLSLLFSSWYSCYLHRHTVPNVFLTLQLLKHIKLFNGNLTFYMPGNGISFTEYIILTIFHHLMIMILLHKKTALLHSVTVEIIVLKQQKEQRDRESDVCKLIGNLDCCYWQF